MAVNPRNFIINSDYKMDKIVFFKEQYVTPDQYGYVQIPHNLGFTPLITGVWSTTSDFTTPHPFSKGYAVYFPDYGDIRYIADVVECVATPTHITLQLCSGASFLGNTYPFYVRLIGFEPAPFGESVASTSQNADSFIVNSNYNYLKLHSAGVIPYGSAGGTSTEIRHNLGYIPQALFWTQYNTPDGIETRAFTYYSTAIPQKTDPVGVRAYNDAFYFYDSNMQYGSDFKIQYRIYYDQAI